MDHKIAREGTILSSIMEIIAGIGIAVGGILLVILLRSLTTLFHELGHALPALFFTKEEVVVFVGSYGDLSNSWHLSFGRLKLYLRWNPFDWKLGMCSHSGGSTIAQQLLITLGGPIASTFIAILALLLMTKEGGSDIWIGVGAIFMGAALIDLAVNLGSYNTEIQMYDGTITYADGHTILRLLRMLNLPERYFAALEDYEAGKYEETLKKCEQLREDGHHQTAIYELNWCALKETDDYEGIIHSYHDYKNHHRLKFSDYLRLAKTYGELGQQEQAIKYYDQCTFLDYTNPVPRYEKGKILFYQDYYGPALEELELSRNLQEEHLDTLALLAGCYLKLKEYAKCQSTLEVARTLDEANEHPVLNYFWGLFQEKEGNIEDALTALKKAQTLGYEHHGLALKIDDLERLENAQK